MRRIGESKRPFFATHGEEGTTYFVHGYAVGIEQKIYFGEFNCLKEARQFIFRYAHRNKEWLNKKGDVNEYNNKPSRPDKDDDWNEDIIRKEYSKYTDFKDWKK